MDLGAITAIVAASFGTLGMIIGFIVGKFSFKGQEIEERLKEVKKEKEYEEKLSFLLAKIETLAKEVKNRITEFSETSIAEVEKKINELTKELEVLLDELKNQNLSVESIKALERALLAIKNIKFNLPSLDESLLTQIKDSLIIVRTDLQSLLMKRQENSNIQELKTFLDSIDSAIKLAKELNARAVKSELITLANSLKNPDKEELLKDLDKQALTSKELVIMLSEIRKKIEGAKK
ncbi:hypothetical protein Dester_0563 [Desulfurobacterium thermolithotrophum DSM 11699]|uniref:Uncharacterized protein n=1 Tax=Desulfurobacterium thermolithotrophum (strain DSM 11699 / BSA) TaxID=868864 RepID=F0S2Z2_DESTD|nr:hypothetical protein [Desulfurobacterium thermolithotrophum]ADY73214.1 hypothetical protein Dester_0563 [Desulfurobacterium thermolithotrophum DSM 11699]